MNYDCADFASIISDASRLLIVITSIDIKIFQAGNQTSISGLNFVSVSCDSHSV